MVVASGHDRQVLRVPNAVVCQSLAQAPLVGPAAQLRRAWRNPSFCGVVRWQRRTHQRWQLLACKWMGWQSQGSREVLLAVQFYQEVRQGAATWR